MYRSRSYDALHFMAFHPSLPFPLDATCLSSPPLLFVNLNARWGAGERLTSSIDDELSRHKAARHDYPWPSPVSSNL